VSLLHSVWTRLRHDWLLAGLVAALGPLILLVPDQAQDLHDLVHWQTLGVLAGLMVLSRGLEDSGYLLDAGAWLLVRLHSERRLAIVLVLLAAALSAVVTNDVTLFIVVPLTLGLTSAARLPIGRLVVFEALAVNAGSALSPVGNPQNLFLWQSSGATFLEFCMAMAPLAAGMLLLLLAGVWFAFAGGAIELGERMTMPKRDRRLLALSLAAYPVFLLLVEAGWVLAATAGVVLVYLAAARRVLAGVDWLLLVVFLLMFVDLGLLARWPPVAAQAAAADTLPGGMLTAGVLVSQLISNVPATIFLAEFAADWRALAWGVNVGGFGLAIGSLANLIALRLVRAPGLWWEFHRFSLPALAGAWLIAWIALG
jgi:Na+/H+ antiporter NhaD/arsenite permease-like protein